MLNTKKDILEDFDRVVEKKADGLYTIPSSKDFENLRVRNVVEYCHKNNKDISKLSDAEIKLFMK